MAARVYWIISHSKKECTFAFADKNNPGSPYRPPKGWDVIDIETVLRGQMETWSQLDKKQQLAKLCPKGYSPVFPSEKVISDNMIARPRLKTVEQSNPRIVLQKSAPAVRQAMKFTVAIIIAGWIITKVFSFF